MPEIYQQMENVVGWKHFRRNAKIQRHLKYRKEREQTWATWLLNQLPRKRWAWRKRTGQWWKRAEPKFTSDFKVTEGHVGGTEKKRPPEVDPYKKQSLSLATRYYRSHRVLPLPINLKPQVSLHLVLSGPKQVLWSRGHRALNIASS